MDVQVIQSAMDTLAPIAATYLPPATGAKIIAGVTTASVLSSVVLAVTPKGVKGGLWSKARKVLEVIAVARGNGTPSK